MAPNVPAVMKKVLAMDSLVYAQKMGKSIRPLMTAKSRNSAIAAGVLSLLMPALTPKTMPSSAKMRTHIAQPLAAKKLITLSLPAQKSEVKAVTSRPRVMVR